MRRGGSEPREPGAFLKATVRVSPPATRVVAGARRHRERVGSRAREISPVSARQVEAALTVRYARRSRAPVGCRRACGCGLPPHTLRMTTAGRMACSARQLVASIEGSRRKELAPFGAQVAHDVTEALSARQLRQAKRHELRPAAHDSQPLVALVLPSLGLEFMSRKEPEQLREDCAMIGDGLNLPSVE